MSGRLKHWNPSDPIAEALRAHGAELRAFFRARAPAAEVEDLFQAAALRAVERAESLRDPDRVLPWLYRLCRNIATDAARRRSTQRRLIEQAATAVEPVDSAIEAGCDCILSQARHIAAGYAKILELVDLHSLSLKDAAAKLGISKNNATVRLHRARGALKQRLRTHCGVTSLRECASCHCVTEGCCAA